MAKRPPETVRVCGKDYTIEGVSKNALGSDRAGEHNCERLRIVYDAEYAPAMQRDTVLHEVIHACEEAAKLEFTEQQVHALSTLLYGVLADNPEFARWLIGK